VFVPLDPQTAAQEVVVTRQAYATLKRDGNYKRRVTWLDGNSIPVRIQISVVEYNGNFSMASAQHGLSKTTGQEYVRTKHKVLTDTEEQLTSGKRPRDVYQQMSASQPDNGPRDVCHVYNRRAATQRHTQWQPFHPANLADEVQLKNRQQTKAATRHILVYLVLCQCFLFWAVIM